MNTGNISGNIDTRLSFLKTKTDYSVWNGMQWIIATKGKEFTSNDFKAQNDAISAYVALSYMAKLGLLSKMRKGVYKLSGVPFYPDDTYAAIKQMMSESSRKWHTKNDKSGYKDTTKLFEKVQSHVSMQLDEAIRICKLHGLRVSQKVEQWKEL